VVVIFVWVTFNYKKVVRFKIILNKLICNYWAFGVSELRTIGPTPSFYGVELTESRWWRCGLESGAWAQALVSIHGKIDDQCIINALIVDLPMDRNKCLWAWGKLQSKASWRVNSYPHSTLRKHFSVLSGVLDPIPGVLQGYDPDDTQT